jgi:hypothetical protein
MSQLSLVEIKRKLVKKQMPKPVYSKIHVPNNIFCLFKRTSSYKVLRAWLVIFVLKNNLQKIEKLADSIPGRQLYLAVI